MGIKERKIKHQEEVTGMILDAAMELYVEFGIEKTSIRNIADKIDYSPATVYLYFKNKTEIMFALHGLGFKQLRSRFEVLFNITDPISRLKTMGRVYLQFANEQPALYELMFVSKQPMLHLNDVDNEMWTEGKATFEVLKMTIGQCIEKGHFIGHDIEPLSFLVWSSVHGMAGLQASKRTSRIKFDDPSTIVARGYAEFEKMIDKL